MGKQSRRKREARRREGDIAADAIKLQQHFADRQEVEICDFCSSPKVKWAYLTDETDATEPKGATKNRGWAACDTCHDLIENGRHNALARRSARAFLDKHPMLGQLSLKVLIQQFTEFHDGFRSSRVGPAITDREFRERHGALGPPLGGRVSQFMQREGIDILMGDVERPGDRIAQPVPPGDQILHRTQERDEVTYIPEGLTPEQLTDPRTVEYLMNRIQRDRPTPKIPLTIPTQPVVREWVGARTYMQACAGVYGETPRADDLFPPRAPMMMAQIVLEPILGAHPLVLEPEQMNAIDHEDWSFAEANDYAQMAHLPFEPIYIDFGGHEPVMVDLRFGQCRLHGAVIWRSGFFKTPTLAVAPIGGFDYLIGPFADAMIEEGMSERDVIRYVGERPGKEIRLGEPRIYGQTSNHEVYRVGNREFKQWAFQAGGICWFGIKTDDLHPYSTLTQRILQDQGETEVPMVFSTEEAIAMATDTPRERIQANILTGMWDTPDIEKQAGWARMTSFATEMVAKLAQRALLGLYFIENAPVRIDETPLSRPERREVERKRKKGRTPGQIASIVVIQSRRSSGSRPEVSSERNYTHRWERRGYFMHLHNNNRHYQNRPDLVKPCHRCSREYDENEQARREGKDLPHPTTESPDCIKIWVEPTVCGPEDLPLKKKVRIRRADHNEEAA